MDLQQTLMFPAGVIILIFIILFHCQHHAQIYTYKYMVLHTLLVTAVPWLLFPSCGIWRNSTSQFLCHFAGWNGPSVRHQLWIFFISVIKRLSPCSVVCLMQVGIRSGQGVRSSAHGGPHSRWPWVTSVFLCLYSSILSCNLVLRILIHSSDSNL